MSTWSEFDAGVVGFMEPRLVVTPNVSAQARSLVAGKSGRWERIRAVAENVQKQVAYLSINLDKDSLAGLRPHSPDDVLKSHFGDCKDKSTLLVALLRSLGEKAYPVLVGADDPTAVMPDWPTQTFNHMVVAIAADGSEPAHWPVIDGGPLGKLVLFDPTDTYTPLGYLPSVDQLSHGLVVSERVAGLSKFPAEDPEVTAVTRKVMATLNGANELTATVDEVQAGSSAAYAHQERSSLGAEKFRQHLEKRLHSIMPLMADLAWTEDWDPVAARRHLNYHFKATAAMRQAGPEVLLVCPRIIEAAPRLATLKKPSEGSVWLPAFSLNEEVALSLPDGFSSDGIPSDWHRELPFAKASLTYHLDGKVLVFTRRYTMQASLLNKADYETVCHFALEFSEAERRPAILRRKLLAAASLP
jgi:hypothetical protein